MIGVSAGCGEGERQFRYKMSERACHEHTHWFDEEWKEPKDTGGGRDRVRPVVVVVISGGQARMSELESQFIRVPIINSVYRAYLSGIKNIRAAFSCTCQPHKKLVIAARTSESRKRL